MSTREFVGGAPPTTLPAGLNDSDLSMNLASGTGYPTGPGSQSFVLTIDEGSATEEHVLCSGRAGNTVTISQRGYADTSPVAHDPGATVSHGWDAEAAQGVHDHLDDTADAHDASAIAYGGSSGLSSTNVEAALDELDTEKAASSHSHPYMDTAGHAATDHSAMLGSAVLGDLADVAATVPVDGQVLTFDTTNGWQPESLPGAVSVFGRWGPSGNHSGTWTAAAMQPAAYSPSGYGRGYYQLPADRAGSIVGIKFSAEFARAAGSALFEVYKNGVATGLTVTMDATNTLYGYTAQARGLDTFVAGDRLEARCSGTSFTSTSTYLYAVAEVLVSYDAV